MGDGPSNVLLLDRCNTIAVPGPGLVAGCRMGITNITSKGQITLPAEFRKREGFHPGEAVDVREVEGGLFVEPAGAGIKKTAGILKHLRRDLSPATTEEMEEAAAAGWAGEPFEEQ